MYNISQQFDLIFRLSVSFLDIHASPLSRPPASSSPPSSLPSPSSTNHAQNPRCKPQTDLLREPVAEDGHLPSLRGGGDWSGEGGERVLPARPLLGVGHYCGMDAVVCGVHRFFSLSPDSSWIKKGKAMAKKTSRVPHSVTCLPPPSSALRDSDFLFPQTLQWWWCCCISTIVPVMRHRAVPRQIDPEDSSHAR